MAVMVKIYLKGWRDSRLYVDAVNDPNHERHAEAWAVRDRSWVEWEADDVTFLAVEYAETDDSDSAICNRAFERFNIGEPERDDVVARYRANGTVRSLSVGDVVVIDDRAYTCASVGWQRVEFTPSPEA
jgi:hypothetical protein